MIIAPGAGAANGKPTPKKPRSPRAKELADLLRVGRRVEVPELANSPRPAPSVATLGRGTVTDVKTGGWRVVKFVSA